jgi:hypothetical protein
MAGSDVAITVESIVSMKESDGDDQGDEVAGHVAGVRRPIRRTWGESPRKVKLLQAFCVINMR